MKRYIDTIYINNPEIIPDIVCALENNPESGSEYEIEYVEDDKIVDGTIHRGASSYKLIVYKIESMKNNSNDTIGFCVKNNEGPDVTAN
jgi:hypothetical protein